MEPKAEISIFHLSTEDPARSAASRYPFPPPELTTAKYRAAMPILSVQKSIMGVLRSVYSSFSTGYVNECRTQVLKKLAERLEVALKATDLRSLR